MREIGYHNEITSDGSSAYINGNGSRVATISAAGVLAAAGAIYEHQPSHRLL